MCGIAGFSDSKAHASNSGPKNDLMLARDAIRHRGPDDSGLYVNTGQGVGLAHTRLSILDLSPSGHQPMFSDNGRTVIVFNGEIYNFRELRAEMERRGHVFRSTSDTEVILHLYQEAGVSALARLNGIFALALWDAERESLLLARDALGVKPLYYVATRHRFAFSSEIKALKTLVDEPMGLDAESLHRYLSFLWCPGEGTPFNEVRKVQPGEALWVRHGCVEDRLTWYRLPVFRGCQQPVPESELVPQVTARLREAVHRQMVADVPVGAFLSGGLDSSSVVAFAREVNPSIQCFTIELEGGQEPGLADDLPYAKRVAAHLGVPLEVVRVDSTRMAQDLQDLVWQLDEPLADPAPLNVLYICRLARRSGLKVLLSGAGGDDLFTGYRRHRALLLEKYWRWLPKAVRRALESTTNSLDQRRPFLRRLSKFFNGADLDGDARLANYFLWIRRDDLLRLYSPAFRSRLQATSAEQPLMQFLSDLPDGTQELERMLAVEQRFFLADHNLTYTDKMSMAVGVEVRVPFLDLDLVDLAARIPPRAKQRGGIGKWALKKAMEPFLPSDVIYRPKSGFGAPLRRWMRHELRELLGDVLSADSLKRRGIFDPTAVSALISANDDGRVDASYTLLSLLSVELWCRRFVDTPEEGCASTSSSPALAARPY